MQYKKHYVEHKKKNMKLDREKSYGCKRKKNNFIPAVHRLVVFRSYYSF